MPHCFQHLLNAFRDRSPCTASSEARRIFNEAREQEWVSRRRFALFCHKDCSLRSLTPAAPASDHFPFAHASQSSTLSCLAGFRAELEMPAEVRNFAAGHAAQDDVSTASAYFPLGQSWQSPELSWYVRDTELGKELYFPTGQLWHDVSPCAERSEIVRIFNEAREQRASQKELRRGLV